MYPLVNGLIREEKGGVKGVLRGKKRGEEKP
jgi:hypothetical protein